MKFNTRKHVTMAIMVLWGLATVTTAQETPLVLLQTMDDSRGWAAVGRLDIDGKGFCTAAMIEEHLILTAAHCIHDADGTLVAPERFEFRAGLRDGRAEATRGVLRAVAHPGYEFRDDASTPPSVALDIAVLQLDRPIRNSRLPPYQIAPNPLAGDEVRVISYGRGREDAPSLQERCNVLGRDFGVIIMTCDVVYGSSGSPVFMSINGEMRIASVVSAMGTLDGERVALGTSLAGPLNALMMHYLSVPPARPGGTQRMISVGERNDTGAKFVRP